MRLPTEYQEEEQNFNDLDIVHEEDTESLSHKRDVRRKLEAHLEKKRLREELDDYDDEFDWDEYE